MADILTTLHPDNDAETNLYPNIKKDNIPSEAIDRNKLDESINELLDNIGELHPSGVDTSTNILAKTSDDGIWVGSDTGKWYYWNGSQYVIGGDYIVNIVNSVSHTNSQLEDNNGNVLYPDITLSNVTLYNQLDDLHSYSGLHSTISTSGNIFTVTSNNDGGTPRLVLRMNTGLSSAHKYYYSITVKPTSILPTKIAIQTMFTYSTIKQITTGIELDKEIIINGVYTSNNNDVNISILSEYTSSINAVFEVYDVHLIDITNISLNIEWIYKITENNDKYSVFDFINYFTNLDKQNLFINSKFKMFTFNSADRRLLELYSPDGINWLGSLSNTHTPEANTCLRDPSILYKDGVYYMIYSRILNDIPYSENYDTDKYIGLATSTDMLHWINQDPIECEGYSNMWAPEWYKKSDGTYAIVLSCKDNSNNITSAYYLPITNFTPFTYGTLTPLSLDGTPTYMIDLDIKSFKGINYLCYTAGNKLRFAKEIDGVFTSYGANADWYNYNIEGGYMVEMDGKMRLYMAYHQNANSIYYSESTDMINWSSAKPCNLPLEALQHCSVLYDDEWIAKKINLL